MTLQTGLLCVNIFFCRILDVSLATVRSILTVRGSKIAAALVGFFEVTIWFLVVQEALTGAGSNLPIALSYSGGFALGTYVGGLMAEWFFHGKMELQIVTSKADPNIVQTIREAGYAVSVVNVNSSQYSGAKYMIFMEIDGRDMGKVRGLLHRLDAGAFIVAQEIKLVNGGFFRRK